MEFERYYSIYYFWVEVFAEQGLLELQYSIGKIMLSCVIRLDLDALSYCIEEFFYYDHLHYSIT